MQCWKFSHQQRNSYTQINTEGLPLKVCTVCGQHKENDRHGREELAGACILHPIVQLLPEGQLVILPLIRFNG